jgi:hypothetical protein
MKQPINSWRLKPWLTTFLLTLTAVTYFYVEDQTSQASFFSTAYYGLPFLLVNSGFADYTAHAIARKCRSN